jgi:hypothetical protein
MIIQQKYALVAQAYEIIIPMNLHHLNKIQGRIYHALNSFQNAQ